MSKRKKHTILGGGYGVPQRGAINASGSTPQVNPFIMPKQMGLSIITNTLPSNYYQTWDLAAWRAACEQARNQGFPINYAALCKFVIESSAFVQGIMREITVQVENSPIFFETTSGEKNEDLTKAICEKKWFKDLCKEIALANFYGFMGLNIDFWGNKCYRYPMQNIDPINQYLRESTYNTGDGMAFADHANMLFIQHSATEEFFLGWMQPISKSFIYMNQQLKNWNAYGTKAAVPQATIGYDANGIRQDAEGNEYNPLKIEAQTIAANLSPENAIVYPKHQDPSGETFKAIDVEFIQSGALTTAHMTFKDFNQELKEEILQMITLSTLSSNAGTHGTQALGNVHERKIEQVHESIQEQIINFLNDEYFLSKLRNFYDIPEDVLFSRNRVKKFKIEEVEKISKAAMDNNIELTIEFFENMGIPRSMMRERENIPTIDVAKKKSLGSLFFLNKDTFRLGDGYSCLSANDFDPISFQDASFLIDEFAKYVYDEQNKFEVFAPAYSYYNSLLASAMAEAMNVSAAYKSINSTVFYEKHLLNAYQFSSAKTVAQYNFLKQNVYDENKKLRPYNEYFELVKNEMRIFNETWLRVEYDMAKRGAVMADKWMKMERDQDIYPFWVYVTAKDERVRDSHKDLNGRRFRIGDPVGDNLYPPNGWNCRCVARQVADGHDLTSDDEKFKLLKNIPDDFRHNVGKDGIFTLKKSGSGYGMFLSSANQLRDSDFSSEKKTKLAAISDNDYASNENYYRNKSLMLNFNIGNKIFNKIDSLTVSQPDRCFARWAGRGQKVVIFVFEKFDSEAKKYNYVEASNGVVLRVYEKKRMQTLTGCKML